MQFIAAILLVLVVTQVLAIHKLHSSNVKLRTNVDYLRDINTRYSKVLEAHQLTLSSSPKHQPYFEVRPVRPVTARSLRR